MAYLIIIYLIFSILLIIYSYENIFQLQYEPKRIEPSIKIPVYEEFDIYWGNTYLGRTQSGTTRITFNGN